jgi:hypothetical protein
MIPACGRSVLVAVVFISLFAACRQPSQPPGVGSDVLQHHLTSTRTGLFVDPLITQRAAAATRVDSTFNAPLPGPTYAQPLYVTNGPRGRAALIAVTEQNAVLTLDAADGARLWTSTLGTPVPRAHLPCGDIDPLV